MKKHEYLLLLLLILVLTLPSLLKFTCCWPSRPLPFCLWYLSYYQTKHRGHVPVSIYIYTTSVDPPILAEVHVMLALPSLAFLSLIFIVLSDQTSRSCSSEYIYTTGVDPPVTAQVHVMLALPSLAFLSLIFIVLSDQTSRSCSSEYIIHY